MSFDKDVSELTCPKCGGDLTDLWDGEPVSAFIGEWSDDRFRCEGKWEEAEKWGRYAWFNRTKSCGYFGLKDLGVKPDEE
ncbi:MULTISPECIES: hypothetical protein [Gallibacterium]|uniref:Uncharacterized protein n=1 Tax=Gallibacterium genomosp. 3 TaxID=505345 RepID=A0A1A7PUE0_9PAST|nr:MULTISPECIES: hypothetical protein [Gallibacterium]OBX06203.1 hypothetical protein QV07_08975 [Gallibacterium genomosp. 3]WIM82222.1 hypothetical protein QP019_00635 [Gallibacterium anatis]WIM82295.1 hypothetical protein QP019_01010 [Gallibacterium anatis]